MLDLGHVTRLQAWGRITQPRTHILSDLCSLGGRDTAKLETQAFDVRLGLAIIYVSIAQICIE